MKTKPYPPYEEQPMVAAEPVAAYQRTDPATYRGMHSSKRGYTQEEVDKMVEEWLHPLTMEQINRWNEEAEEADETDDMDAFVSHEAVVERMKRLMDSL